MPSMEPWLPWDLGDASSQRISEDTKQLMKFVLPHMTGFDWWRIYGAFVGSGQHLIKSGLVVGKCWEDVRFL